MNSQLLHTPRVRSRSEDRRARPGGGSRSPGAPTATAGSLSATADGPREADPTAGRRLTLCSAQLGISRILVSTSGELILLPVWERHPKLTVGQRPLTRYSDSDIRHHLRALSRHFALSESKMAAKTTSGSGFIMKFRLLAHSFLLES